MAASSSSQVRSGVPAQLVLMKLNGRAARRDNSKRVLHRVPAGRAIPLCCARRWVRPVLHDLLLESLHQGREFASLTRGDVQVLERGTDVSHERLPLPLGDAHPYMCRAHITANVVRGAACSFDKEVDEVLTQLTDAVLAHMVEVSFNLRVFQQPR